MDDGWIAADLGEMYKRKWEKAKLI